jgi:hypothetical protein
MNSFPLLPIRSGKQLRKDEGMELWHAGCPNKSGKVTKW